MANRVKTIFDSGKAVINGWLALAIYDRVIAECAKRKIFAAVHTGGAEDATKCIARGFRLVTLTNDVSLMAMAARGAVAQTRKESKGVA